MPAAELAAAFGVSTSTIRNIRRGMSSGHRDFDNGSGGSYWTANEDALIRDLGPNLTAKQMERHLPGRTWQAISDRRRKLGVSARFNADPRRIGSRPLIAKSCYECGLLLQADWFAFYPSRRTWSQRCKKCDSAYTQRQPGNRAYIARSSGDRDNAAKKWLREAQSYTMERATRNGQEYTDADMEVLSNPDLTTIDKALALGRTYFAIRSACDARGMKSHVGLGDPQSDQWIIDNPNDRKAS